MRKSKFTESQIVAILAEGDAGLPVAEVCRKYFTALPLPITGILSLGYLGGIVTWISGLRGDSFLETRDFDVHEAFFWINTLISSITQMLLPMNKTSLLILVETILLSIILFIILWWKPFVRHVIVVVLTVSAIHLGYLGYIGFESGRGYVKKLHHQFDPNPIGFKATSDVDLFVYIGESTTSLSMSLYGYPLSTTPQLDKISREDWHSPKSVDIFHSAVRRWRSNS